MTRNPTEKQQRFVDEFIIDLSIKKASNRAGLNYDYCRRLVTKSHILEAIQKAKQARSERTQIDQDYLLKRFQELESFDFLSIIDEETGSLKNPKDWPEAALRTIISYEVEEKWIGSGEDRVSVGATTKIRIESRSKALESIAKHVSFYPNPKIKTASTDGFKELLERVKNSPLGSPQGRLKAGVNTKVH